METRELRPNDWVVIPAGVAHGFLAMEALRLLYLVTNEYDGSDELGFAWDDPAVGVPWPVVDATSDGRPILSERDASNPSLAESGSAPCGYDPPGAGAIQVCTGTHQPHPIGSGSDGPAWLGTIPG